mgnify:CR=1 FL=1
MEDVFGTLVKGDLEAPAIVKSSIHHYAKEVSGKPLIRPAWFFDTKQQGEGLVDVSSHLVDLTFWECSPDQAILKEDIELLNKKKNTTSVWSVSKLDKKIKILKILNKKNKILKHYHKKG